MLSDDKERAEEGLDAIQQELASRNMCLTVQDGAMVLGLRDIRKGPNHFKPIARVNWITSAEIRWGIVLEDRKVTQ